MDNTYNKTSDDIIAVFASFYNREELIIEIIKARAKMLEPKKKKNKKRRRKRKHKKNR